LYAITESWLSGDILNSEIMPSDYTVLRHDRDPKTSGRKVGGGVFLDVPLTSTWHLWISAL